MASSSYRAWVAAGRPYRLITPAAALQRNVRRYGITVYDYPDAAHLLAATPEDHTPFSVTGWPGENARGFARGLDIMPRSDSFAHRKENADIARQIIADKDGDHPGTEWIKYLNWTDEDGRCYQVRWMPSKAVRSSTDRGHIHISGRSDHDSWTGAEHYDPIARMKGDDMDPTLEAALRAAFAVPYDGRSGIHPQAWVPQALERPLSQLRAELAALRAQDAANAVADEARDRVIIAALQSGADPDAAAGILAAVHEARDESRTKFAELHAELVTVIHRAEEAEARAAHAEALLAAGRQALAEAGG